MGGQMELYSIYCGSVVYKDKEDKIRVECGQIREEKDTQAIALADLQEVSVGLQSPLVTSQQVFVDLQSPHATPQRVFVDLQSAHATSQRVIWCIKCAPAIFFALFGRCFSVGLSTVARQTNPNRSCRRAGDAF